MKKYLKADFARVFTNCKAYISIVAIAILMIVGAEGVDSDSQSVLGALQTFSTSKFIMAIFVVCAVIYAECLVDDLETKYIRYQVMRGNLEEYAISKVVTVLATVVIVMVAGSLLFVGTYSLFKPMMLSQDFEQAYVQLSELYNEKYIFLWVAIWGLRFGILAGILALFAMLTSLFITNKMLVLAMPALIYELLLEVSAELNKLNIDVFNLSWYYLSLPAGDILTQIRGILFNVICVIATTEIVIYKLKRRL